jgi:hypothetical protein
MRYLGAAVLGLLLVWQVYRTWGDNNYREYTLPEDYALNICRSAGPESVIISETWDHHAQTFYLQQVEYIRPDLRFVDKELLRRSWYYDQLRNLYPDVYRLIEPYVSPFLRELAVFEAGGEYNARELERYFQAMINILVAQPEALIDGRLTFTQARQYYLKRQGILMIPDTTSDSPARMEPQLVWRGKPLDDYTDWRAMEHVNFVRQLQGFGTGP